MNEPEPRATMLLARITQIEDLLDEEEFALRRLDLGALEAIRQRKETAAEAYERALRECLCEHAVFAALETEERDRVAMRMRAFQARMRRNTNIIAALRDASERLLRSLSAHSQAVTQARCHPADPRLSSVVALTLNKNF